MASAGRIAAKARALGAQLVKVDDIGIGKGTADQLGEILLRLGDEDAMAYSLVNELMKLPESDPRRMRDYLPAVQTTWPSVPLLGARTAKS